MTMPPLPDDIDPYFARFGEAQMLDYAYAVRAATIEECAKGCEKFKTGEDGYIDDDWADMCAAAIRALKEGK